jgi:hypothetical protein
MQIVASNGADIGFLTSTKIDKTNLCKGNIKLVQSWIRAEKRNDYHKNVQVMDSFCTLRHTSLIIMIFIV